MDFSFGAARARYDAGQHPRLYVSPEDGQLLRHRAASGEAERLLRALRQRLAPIARSIHETKDLAEELGGWNRAWNLPGTRMIFGLRDLAALAWLEGDPELIGAVKRVLTHAGAASAKARPEAVRAFPGTAGGALCIAYDFIHEHLSESERQTFRAWVVESVIRRQNKIWGHGFFKNSGGNMQMGPMHSALLGLLVMAGEPGVPPLTAERELVVKMFEAAVNGAVNESGYPEEDIGYGTSVGAVLADSGEVLRRAGWFDYYKQTPRLARLGTAVLHFVQPWGEALTNTGDHGDDFGHREFILGRQAAELGRPELLWLLGTLTYDHGRIHPANSQPDFYRELHLSQGVQVPVSFQSLMFTEQFPLARHPRQSELATAFCDPQRGLVSFRDSWRPEATYVTLDGSQRSPAAQGHAHASGGHFNLSALGEYFSIDTGRYNNDQTCHSVVLVDGKPGRDLQGEWTATKHAGRLTHYAPGKVVDWASVDSSHQHNCYWAWRHLGLVKGPGRPAYVWIVDDLNKADDWAEFHWQLQSCPENRIEHNAESATIHGWRHGNLLDVHFVLPAPDLYPKPHVLLELTQDVAGPSATKYVNNVEGHAREFVRPAAMVHGPVYQRPRLVARIGGYNGRFMSLLLPRRAGDEATRVERLPTLPGALAVRLSTPTIEDTLIWSFNHNLLEAGEVVGRGRWCLVRRDLRTGAILTHALGDGTALRHGSTILHG